MKPTLEFFEMLSSFQEARTQFIIHTSSTCTDYEFACKPKPKTKIECIAESDSLDSGY